MVGLYSLTAACIVCMVVANCQGSCMQEWMKAAGIPDSAAADYEGLFTTIGLSEEDIYSFDADKLSLLMHRNHQHAKALKHCLVGKLGDCRGYHPCHVGGECLFNDTQAGYVCHCANGRRGASCQQDVYAAGIRAASSAISRLELKVQGQAVNAAKAEARLEKLEEKLGLCPACDLKSCKEIQAAYLHQDGVRVGSGYYNIKVNGVKKQVYCEMERYGGGWTRVANIQPTDEETQSCPGDLLYRDLEVDVCTRRPVTHGSCDSANFTSIVTEYSEVMGYVTGYKDRSIDAFFRVDGTDFGHADGVAIFQGSSRKHIWTYTASFGDASTTSHCPCNAVPGTQPPSFVGNHYYCTQYGTLSQSWQFGNPAAHLWSATGKCSVAGSCCSNQDMPWFKRDLAGPTTGDLEIQICLDQLQTDEDVGIDAAAIFVR